MMLELSNFTFNGNTQVLDPELDFIARIPAGLSSRDALFEVLSRQLHFPSYFGRNWDALSDCLRDLSWIERRRVVIVHEDLPLLEAKTLTTYLQVLSECVRDWKPGEAHELIVVFPETVRDSIAHITPEESR